MKRTNRPLFCLYFGISAHIRSERFGNFYRIFAVFILKVIFKKCDEHSRRSDRHALDERRAGGEGERVLRVGEGGGCDLGRQSDDERSGAAGKLRNPGHLLWRCLGLCGGLLFRREEGDEELGSEELGNEEVRK